MTLNTTRFVKLQDTVDLQQCRQQRWQLLAAVDTAADSCWHCWRLLTAADSCADSCRQLLTIYSLSTTIYIPPKHLG